MLYSSGYKYVLRHKIEFCTGFLIGKRIETQFITLDSNGLVVVRPGYAWDGPSGPAIDTPSFMFGSLIHDALYQLMREGYLDPQIWKDPADVLLRLICIKCGMLRLRAWWVYHSVRVFGWPATRAASEKTNTAPIPSAKGVGHGL